jgi:hypothetical protein
MGAIWIAGFLIPSSRVVLFLVVEFVKKSAMYAHHVALWLVSIDFQKRRGFLH